MPVRKKPDADVTPEADQKRRILQGTHITEILEQLGTQFDPMVGATMLLQKLIYPVTEKVFLDSYFEKQPLVVLRNGTVNPGPDSEYHYDINVPYVVHDTSNKRNRKKKTFPAHYFDGIFSRDIAQEICVENELLYGADLDLTAYSATDNKRTTPSNDEEMLNCIVSADIWDQLDDHGFSARFLCPQQFSPELHQLLYGLDVYFGYQCGANAYYTPANTQGFAPHFDEVDILILQCEGSKRWRLYANNDENNILSRVSSPNFQQSELTGELLLDVVLQPGDFLYAPRGTIHQCVSSDASSMHVTVSTCLDVCYAAVMEKAFKQAVRDQCDSPMRLCLPRNYTPSDKKLTRKVKDFQALFLPVVQAYSADAVERLKFEFFRDRVPPPQHAIVWDAKYDLNMSVRFMPYTVLLTEGFEKSVQLWHTLENAVRVRGNPMACFELESHMGPAVHMILEEGGLTGIPIKNLPYCDNNYGPLYEAMLTYSAYSGHKARPDFCSDKLTPELQSEYYQGLQDFIESLLDPGVLQAV